MKGWEILRASFHFGAIFRGTIFCRAFFPEVLLDPLFPYFLEIKLGNILPEKITSVAHIHFRRVKAILTE